jgi:hypothetical protein
LQKKRLVDILEEACDLDPLNAVGDLAGGAGASSSQLTATNGLGVVAVTNSPSSKRRRNSLTSRLNACSKGPSSLFHSPSFASDSSSTTDQSSSTSKVRFATSPPQVRYFSNYLPSMTEKEREQVRTSIWYTVRCIGSSLRALFVRSIGSSLTFFAFDHCFLRVARRVRVVPTGPNPHDSGVAVLGGRGR